MINGKDFDVVLLNGVLEHLLNVQSCIDSCKKLLKENGLLALTVPDIAMFKEHEDLYQEFSAEHINYFGLESLNKIMHEKGFSLESYHQDHESLMGLAGNMVTLWRYSASGCKKEKSDGLILRDEDTIQRCLDEYLKKCEYFQAEIAAKVKRYNLDKGYYIWGAGTNTAMLVQLGIIKIDLVKGVYDSNVNYQGCYAYGSKIQKPLNLIHSGNLPILISSQYAYESIKKTIIDMGLKNEIITIFG